MNLVGRRLVQRPHGNIVRMELVDGKLFSKVIQRIKAVAGAKAFLTLSVAALLSIVMKRVGEGKLISDAQCDSGNLK